MSPDRGPCSSSPGPRAGARGCHDALCGRTCKVSSAAAVHATAGNHATSSNLNGKPKGSKPVGVALAGFHNDAQHFGPHLGDLNPCRRGFTELVVTIRRGRNRVAKHVPTHAQVHRPRRFGIIALCASAFVETSSSLNAVRDSRSSYRGATIAPPAIRGTSNGAAVGRLCVTSNKRSESGIRYGDSWRATTTTGGDMSRQPSADELAGARYQSERIGQIATRLLG
jgi:hypothetical protein